MSYLFNHSLISTATRIHNPLAGYINVARLPSKSYAGMIETRDVQAATPGFWCASQSYRQEVNVCL
jgi:hypothetical protein